MEGDFFEMIYTVCIKTNNTKILDYLLNSMQEISLENTFISRNTFKLYENVIFHYTGDNSRLFYSSLSKILANCIVNFYEASLVRKIISSNYFYFSDSEKQIIYKKCLLDLATTESLIIKLDLISKAANEYFLTNTQMVLDGFVNFRLKEYINLLDTSVDLNVDNFLVEREYTEFVNLLKIYIDSKPSLKGLVHLIYAKGEAILLDENRKIIDTSSSILNAKYLSDITFSINDYALNTLLTLLPKKIKVHLKCEKDEFINTIELIFGNRVSFCNSCSLCKEKYNKNLRKDLFYD